MRDLRHILLNLLTAVAVAALCGAAPGDAVAATAPSWSLPMAITTQAPFAHTGTLTQISCADSDDCLAGAVGPSASGVIYRTADGGRSWSTARAADDVGGGAFACSPDAETETDTDTDAETDADDAATPVCVGLYGDQVENLSAPGAPVIGPANVDVLLNLAAAMSCPSSELCVAAGSLGQDGEISWSTDPLTGDWSSADIDPGHQLTAISCPDSALCVAVDDDGGVEVSTDPAGGSWSRTQVGAGLDAVSCPTDSWCVAVGSGGGAHVSTDPAGGAWTEESSGTGFAGVSCAAAGSCVATASDGTVYQSSGPSHAFAATFSGLPPGLGEVACPTSGACEAVDGADVEVSGASPPGWTTVPVDAWTPLTAVACPSTALCVAMQQDGRAEASTAPLMTGSAWTVSSADPGGTPVALSCPAATACFGVDAGGHLLWSTAPASGGWQVLKIDREARPVAISCPTVSFCAVADAGGRVFTSIDPSGGRTGDWHMVARATPTRVSHGQTETLTAISCPSASFCLATDSGGWIYTSTDPRGSAGAWKATQIWKHPSSGYYSLSGASCPTSGNCTVAATYTGWFGESGYDPDALGTYALTSTRPTGGARAWKQRQVDGGYVESDASTDDPGTATGLSCPTTGLCAIVDDLGTAVTDTGPAGANNWREASIDALATPDMSDGHPGLTGVSCFRGGHCVAVDGFGNRFVFGVGAGPIAPTPGITYQGG